MSRWAIQRVRGFMAVWLDSAGLWPFAGLPSYHERHSKTGSLAMTENAAQRALSASTLALVVACASIVPLLPPMVEHTVQSVPRLALLGCAITAGMFLHWIFLGIAAQRLGRSVFGWVALAVLSFPIGGIAALILLAFFGDEATRQAPSPAPGR
jgi:hypothetical protein